MKWHYRERLFLAYRCELLGTLLRAFVIELLIAIALKVLAPEVECFTILLSLLAVPLIMNKSQ